MTLKWVANWYKAKLQSLASAWYDVSWYEWIYTNIQNTVDWLLTPTNWSTPVQKQDTSYKANNWKTYNLIIK
jgi:hypothetical protein